MCIRDSSKSIKQAWDLTVQDRKNNLIPKLNNKEESPDIKKHKSNLYLDR